MPGTMVMLALALVGLVAWWFLHQPKVPAATTSADAGVSLSAVHPADVPVIMHSMSSDPQTGSMPATVVQVDPAGAVYAADFQKSMTLNAASMGAAAAASQSQNEYYRTHPQ